MNDEANGDPMASAGRHLDAERWRALLAAPRPDPALLEHLVRGCEACELFLAAHTDDLDGEVDRVLLAAGPERSAPLDELGWLKLRRRLGRPRERTRRLVIGAALAAGLLVAAGASLVRPQGPGGWDGLKRSTAAVPTLHLSAARRQSDQAFVRLDDGARVTAGSVLVLRATSSIDGPARVYLQGSGQDPVEVGEVALRAGTHELLTDSGLLGVSLEGERGEVRVWVVVGEGPFSAHSALEAIGAPGRNDLATASVRVQVE